MRLGRETQSRTSAPLGLLCIATPLDLAGYRVKIIDQGFERKWKNILLSELEKKPVCLGVSTKTGPQIRYAIEASSIAKQHGETPVVWGGVHPSLLPEQTLKNQNIDIVVQGEGEETFFELVQALEQNRPLNSIKGIWYKENGEIRKTEPRPFIDLNKRFFPSYHLVDLTRYSLKLFGIDHVWFSSSRGCPYRCGFCYNTVFNKGTWRGLTAEKTLDGIKRIRREYSFRGINLTDDLFFKDIERVKKILSGIVDKEIDVVVSKLDIHGHELSKIDDDFLGLLENAGCKSIIVGVESGSQRILNLINKNINISQVLEFNKRIRKFPIIPKYSFMMGFPTETKDDIQQTVSLIFKLIEDNEEAMKDMNIYSCYPGTVLYDLAIEKGLKPPESLEEWASVNWRTINRKYTPWVTRERERLLKMLHCSSLFLEKNYFLEPIRPTNPFIVMLARLYHPIAKKRVQTLYHKFAIEIKLAEWLNLYPKQG